MRSGLNLLHSVLGFWDLFRQPCDASASICSTRPSGSSIGSSNPLCQPRSALSRCFGNSTPSRETPREGSHFGGCRPGDDSQSWRCMAVSACRALLKRASRSGSPRAFWISRRPGRAVR
jgi:hypothetical protein